MPTVLRLSDALIDRIGRNYIRYRFFLREVEPLLNETHVNFIKARVKSNFLLLSSNALTCLTLRLRCFFLRIRLRTVKRMVLSELRNFIDLYFAGPF